MEKYADKTFLNEKEVAELARVSLSKIRNDRWLRTGFPFYKNGRHVLYKRMEVISIIEQGRVQVAQ